MKLSDTRIHQIELLLTLDYLLRFTDETHPATQQDICRHANDFGLKYDPKAKRGNSVRRQRIADCLHFLFDCSSEFPDSFPFVLQRTDSGKYYIEGKNYLDEQQLLTLTSCVDRDKSISAEEATSLIDALFEAFSTIPAQKRIKGQLQQSDKRFFRYENMVLRKIKLVRKAYRERKLLKIHYILIGVGKGEGKPSGYDVFYRVYRLMEYDSTPWAILLPVNQGPFPLSRKIISKPIAHLYMPNIRQKDVLCDEVDENRDLDKLFMELSESGQGHVSPEDMLKAAKRFQGGSIVLASFYFPKFMLSFVKPSFEEFFSCPLEYEICSCFEIDESGHLHPCHNASSENSRPAYCIVNTFVDCDSFCNWLVRPLRTTDDLPAIGAITLVRPIEAYKSCYLYYRDLENRMKARLDELLGERWSVCLRDDSFKRIKREKAPKRSS